MCGGAYWELQYLHSKSIDSHISVSTEAPALEEYKPSASVQSLLITPETGWKEQQKIFIE